MMSFSPSNLARTASESQLSGRRRSFLNLAHRPALAGRSPMARSTPWLSTCTLTWSLRNPGSEISTTSTSPAVFHSTTGSKSSNSRSRAAAPRRRSMVDRRRTRRRTARRPSCARSIAFAAKNARARTATPPHLVFIYSRWGGGKECHTPSAAVIEISRHGGRRVKEGEGSAAGAS
jgi:hypothetical protein